MESLGKSHFIVNIKKRGEDASFEGEQDCHRQLGDLPMK